MHCWSYESARVSNSKSTINCFVNFFQFCQQPYHCFFVDDKQIIKEIVDCATVEQFLMRKACYVKRNKIDKSNWHGVCWPLVTSKACTDLSYIVQLCCRVLLLYDPDGHNEVLDLFCHFVISAHHNDLKLNGIVHQDYKKFHASENPNFTLILTEDVGHKYSGIWVFACMYLVHKISGA